MGVGGPIGKRFRRTRARNRKSASVKPRGARIRVQHVATLPVPRDSMDRRKRGVHPCAMMVGEGLRLPPPPSFVPPQITIAIR